ncbi:energy-coupling factor ABC transporter permease [Catenovulum sp. SM1970]|uniref:energy-coupling factor ABC transporter permease n=1 Tax=Marinifaba aquimaris TaxID=2741323 RepID=UPI001571B4BE|nr:energy-coupling factor ABC transporter permease [Marinifaba aquimaris]NTS77012.1 energy-coupling factor ABC transporter permease [Marinifaba aquimaris]
MTSWQLIAYALTLLVFFISFDKKHYQLLLIDSSKQHLVFGTSFALTVLWAFKTGIYPGLDVHFLWLTAASLFLGPHLALVAGLIALITNKVIDQTITTGWQHFGIHALCDLVIPIAISYFVYLWAYHKLPRHFAVYTFICAFFAGALAIGAKSFSIATLYWLNGDFTWSLLVDNLLIITPLLLFPEALLNGMTMTLAVVYLPEWVRSFYDEEYLDK